VPPKVSNNNNNNNNVGGLIGYCDNIDISNCYSNGNVKVSSNNGKPDVILD